jgi:hypothetical protein
VWEGLEGGVNSIRRVGDRRSTSEGEIKIQSRIKSRMNPISLEQQIDLAKVLIPALVKQAQKPTGEK